MKKAFLLLVFIIAYASFLSIGSECLLNLMGMSVAISLDGQPVNRQFPRFIPFCLIVGVFALVGFVLTLIFNLKVSEKFNTSKKIWCAQMVIAVVISIPMIKLWEMIFEYLQRSL